jgi:hypothetical protein
MRRREQRYTVKESVVVSVLNTRENRPRPGTVLDISRSGYRVLSGLALSEGTEVLTTLNSVAIFGIVRHCELAGEDSYTTGVQITKVVPVSEAQVAQAIA